MLNNRLWLPKTPSDLKTQGFQPFVRLWWYHDELSFRRPFRFDSIQFSNLWLANCYFSQDSSGFSVLQRFFVMRNLAVLVHHVWSKNSNSLKWCGLGFCAGPFSNGLLRLRDRDSVYNLASRSYRLQGNPRCFGRACSPMSPEQ